MCYDGKNMLRFLTSLFAMLSFVCFARAQPANILLIIADDFGVDTFPLTASGGTVPPMPKKVTRGASTPMRAKR